MPEDTAAALRALLAAYARDRAIVAAAEAYVALGAAIGEPQSQAAYRALVAAVVARARAGEQP